MKPLAVMTISIALLLPISGSANPTVECGLDNGSQIEIGRCVADMERRVDHSVEVAYGFALAAAKNLDEVTGRALAVDALERSQEAWSSYRDEHCAYVGTTFGGGSGTGIGIRACRVELGRVRAAELIGFAQ